MYGIVKQFISMQHELSQACRYTSEINAIIKNLTVERGDNVSFTGPERGLTYGGRTSRTLPKRY